jgi:hypothetical protein
MQPPYSIVLKIIISYLQVITVIKNVGLELPGFFDGFLGSNRQASSASGSLVVLECSLQDKAQNGGLSKSLQQALVMVSVPFIFLAAAPLVWLAIYKLRQQFGKKKVAIAQVSSVQSDVFVGSSSVEPFLQDPANHSSTAPLVKGSESDFKIRAYLSRRMIITFLVVIFVMYPDTTDAFMSLFSCTCLDNSVGPYAVYRLATGCYFSYDMTTKCYSGQHLLVMLLVGIPGAFLWALGIPIGFAVYLWYYRARLDEKVFSGRHSIMYQDYKPSFYQWESIILLRKFCIVIVGVCMPSVELLPLTPSFTLPGGRVPPLHKYLLPDASYPGYHDHLPDPPDHLPALPAGEDEQARRHVLDEHRLHILHRLALCTD